MTPLAEAQLATAVDIALSCGLIQRDERGEVVHAPLTLTPCPVAPATAEALQAQILPWNALTLRVASDLDLLREALDEVAAADPFIRALLDLCQEARGARELRLLLTRSDYFLQERPEGGLPRLCHVEHNTIAASYPGLAGRMADFHRAWLGLHPGGAELVPNAPVEDLAEAMAEAVARYDHPRGRVLMIVQAGERNVFDQRLLEAALAARGLASIRATLEEVGDRARLKDGHLCLGEDVAAVTYFRAGYGPADLATPEALAARRLIEHSATISVPDLATQLAGTKTLQQRLTDPTLLRACVSEGEARVLASAFMAMHPLEAPAGPAGEPAWRLAAAHPEDWVLKPQREGGGNNHYGQDMVRVLEGLDARSRRAWVLMQRIRPTRRPALLLNRGRLRQAEVVSEIGWFGSLLARGPEVLRERASGYLVRTRPHDATESGVSAGYGHLDSLALTR